MSKAKRNALLLLTVAAALVMLLAMTLQSTTLFEGEPFAIDPQAPEVGASGVSSSNVVEWIVRGMVAITIVLLPVYIVYSLFSKQGRQRLIRNLIVLALILFIAEQLRDRLQQFNPEQQEQQGVMDQMPINGEGAIPSSIFPAETPPWLTVAVVLVAAALLVGVALAVLVILRSRRQYRAAPSLDALAEAAQQTITAIHSGGDLRTSVIACYREMSRVVQEQRGLSRETAMTPREFEDVLISKGLPGDAVKNLTRLFEGVRYGSAADGAKETEQAIASLTEIVDYCQNSRSYGGAYAG
jgi:hypothetical protein